MHRRSNRLLQEGEMMETAQKLKEFIHGEREWNSFDMAKECLDVIEFLLMKEKLHEIENRLREKGVINLGLTIDWLSEKDINKTMADTIEVFEAYLDGNYTKAKPFGDSNFTQFVDGEYIDSVPSGDKW
jgi:hypothetical protein